VAKRSSGVFASARMMARSTPSGSGSRDFRGGGGAVMCCASSEIAVEPAKGGFPEIISYSTQPSAYWSQRPSRGTSPGPACSGLMYVGVPTTMPVFVICVVVVASTTARAMPKSEIIACPSAMRMLSGLMSRWMIPWRCA
jgi:hypothetical protein